MSEQCEQTSERMSEWPSSNIAILGGSVPQCHTVTPANTWQRTRKKEIRKNKRKKMKRRKDKERMKDDMYIVWQRPRRHGNRPRRQGNRHRSRWQLITGGAGARDIDQKIVAKMRKRRQKRERERQYMVRNKIN